MDKNNALNAENFETYLVANLFPENEVDLNSVNVNLDFFEK
jgi:hypothetical protein